jgi:hypothetical protein
VLSAFDHDASYTDDGQGTSRTWLRWQTQVTVGAASGSMAWMRRLRAHPAIADALRSGAISEHICEWTDLMPKPARQDIDTILLAAAGGAELADLASLVEQMRRKLARPDEDSDGGRGFDERRVRLATTIGGAGKLDGDLTQMPPDPRHRRPAAQRPRRPRPAVAMAGRPRRPGPGPDLARLPAPVRAHVPVRQARPRVGQGRPPRTSLPMDLAHHRRDHPAAAGPPDS